MALARRAAARILTVPWSLTVWLLALPLASAAGAQEAPGSAGPRVDSVDLIGVESIDPVFLWEVIVTDASRCRSLLLAPVCAISDARWAVEPAFLDPADVAEDAERIRSVYQHWGFFGASVASHVIPRRGGSVEVRFVVSEGEPVTVRSLTVRGVEGVPYDPSPARRYPLLLRAVHSLEQVYLGHVTYAYGFDEPSRARETWRRLQLQFSAAPPF
jgi:hypothetical protein